MYAIRSYYVAFNEGTLAYITGGKHVGEFAKVIEVEKRTLYSDIVTLENKDGEKFKTIKPYVFVITSYSIHYTKLYD